MNLGLDLQCPIEEATNARRAFVNALHADENAFSLPVPLPKCIAVVSFCGRKMLLTSSRFHLLSQFACLPRGSAVYRQLQILFQYAALHGDCSLLMTYVMPLHLGSSAVWWDVRTVRKGGACSYTDGQLTCNIDSMFAMTTVSTTELETQSEDGKALLKKQRLELERELVAIDLDAQVASVRGNTESRPKTELTHSQATAMVRLLQADRKKMQETHRRELDSSESETHTRILEAKEAALQVEKNLRTQLGNAMRLIEKGTVKLSSQEEAHLQVCADFRAKQLEYESDLEACAARGRAAEQSYAKQCAKREKLHQKQLLTLAQTMDGMESKIQSITLCERERREAEVLLSLERVNEAKRTSDTAQSSKVASTKRNILALRVALLLGVRQQRVLTAQLKHHINNKEVIRSSVATADCAVQTCGMSKDAIELGVVTGELIQAQDIILCRDNQIRSLHEELATASREQATWRAHYGVGGATAQNQVAALVANTAENINMLAQLASGAYRVSYPTSAVYRPPHPHANHQHVIPWNWG